MTTSASQKSQVFDKARSLLSFTAGDTCNILDFGCGNGEFLGGLANSLGKGSRLVGIDADERAISQANTAHPDMEFKQGEFTGTLEFADASFNAIVTIDTLECIIDKAALLREFHRVLKPGGEILAMHWDWDTQTYNIASKAIARRAVEAFSDWQQPWMQCSDGQMGRKLRGLFECSGLFKGMSGTFSLLETNYKSGKYGFDRAQDLAVLVEQGGFDAELYRQFLHELDAAHAANDYLYTVTSFIYHGRKV